MIRAGRADPLVSPRVIVPDEEDVRACRTEEHLVVELAAGEDVNASGPEVTRYTNPPKSLRQAGVSVSSDPVDSSGNRSYSSPRRPTYMKGVPRNSRGDLRQAYEMVKAK